MAQAPQQPHAPFHHQLSSYLRIRALRHGLSGVAAAGAAAAVSSKTSALPTSNFTCSLSHPSDSDHADDRSDGLLSTASAAHVSPARPPIGRSKTAAASATASPSLISAYPPSLRPRFSRAITSASTLIGRSNRHAEDIMADARASFLTRATQALSDQLELGDRSSYTRRHAPPTPSNWSDQAHQRYLVRLWDAVEEKAATSNGTWTITQRVVSTEKSMVRTFPELGEGDKPLSRDWIEYVLGVSLRHPFCTAENMGRWEILASSSGARGTWGPW